MTRLVDLSMPVHRDMITFPQNTATHVTYVRELD